MSIQGNRSATAAAEGWREETLILLGTILYALWVSGVQSLSGQWPTWSFSQLLVGKLLIWPSFALISLPVYRLIRRFPIARPHRLRRFLLYAALGPVVSLAYQLFACAVIGRYDIGVTPGSSIGMFVMGLTADQSEYWSLVVLMHALLFHRRARESAARLARLDADALEARLVDVKEAIRPQFLLSTLRAAAAQVPTDASALRRLLARLGDFLRLTQKGIGAPTACLEDELALVETLIDLERAARGDRVSCRIDVHREALGKRISRRRLQPALQASLGELARFPAATARVSVSTSPDASSVCLSIDFVGLGDDARHVAAVLGAHTDLGDWSARVPSRGRVELRVEVALQGGLEAPDAASSWPDDGVDANLVGPVAAEASRPAGSARSLWWTLGALWACAAGWTISMALVRCGLCDLAPLVIPRLVWGVVGIPVLGVAALRFPFKPSRLPAYLGLGIALGALCSSAIWYLGGGTVSPLMSSHPPDPGAAVFMETGGLWAFSVLAVIANFVVWEQRHEEGLWREAAARRQIAVARLQALEMQLRPHFLFNALHSVSALLGSDAASARQMLLRIEDFLRLSLESAGAPTVALRDELTFLRHYFAIQEVRFQDRLSTDVHVEPEALEALVPHLILQPIVENAVRHGIAPRVAGGRIRVRAVTRRGRLELSVEDDGVGTEAPVEEGRFGLGLSNTKARLRLLYGQDHRFEIATGHAGTFTVLLDIPFRRPKPLAPARQPGPSMEAAAPA